MFTQLGLTVGKLRRDKFKQQGKCDRRETKSNSAEAGWEIFKRGNT